MNKFYTLFWYIFTQIICVYGLFLLSIAVDNKLWIILLLLVGNPMISYIFNYHYSTKQNLSIKYTIVSLIVFVPFLLFLKDTSAFIFYFVSYSVFALIGVLFAYYKRKKLTCE